MSDETSALPELDAEGFASTLADGGSPVLVEYFMKNCVWCERIEPVLVAAAAKYGERLRIAKLNASLHPQALPAGGIRGTPTIALYRAGRLVMSKSGMMQSGPLAAFLDHWLDPANAGLSES